MKILILSNANSSHTIKWVNSLTKIGGLTIGLWSLDSPEDGVYAECTNLQINSAGIPQRRKGVFAKLKYLTSLSELKTFIREFKPDIIHAHYASSYGLLGRLTNFHPFIISVWGSDIFAFPKKNQIFKALLERNLNSADLVLSTSHIMKAETKKYTRKKILVTPFGVDTNVFKPNLVSGKCVEFVFGTIKTLEKIYGIEYLIRAYKVFKDRNPITNSSLLIVGGGSQLEMLRELSHQLGISESVTFIGQVAPEEIPKYYNMIDVAVFLSLEESFGVAVLEAMAIERPVVVSDAVGLKEIVDNGFDGIIVPKENIEAAALAMEKLFQDEKLRKKLGQNARQTVMQKYQWKDNVRQMESIYTSLSQ